MNLNKGDYQATGMAQYSGSGAFVGFGPLGDAHPNPSAIKPGPVEVLYVCVGGDYVIKTMDGFNCWAPSDSLSDLPGDPEKPKALMEDNS